MMTIINSWPWNMLVGEPWTEGWNHWHTETLMMVKSSLYIMNRISMDSWSSWWWSWWRCQGGWLWWGKWGWWWCWWWEEEDSIVGNLPVMGWVSTNTANFLSPFLHRAFPLKTKTTNTKTSTKPNIDKNWRSWVESVQIQLTASTFYKVLSCLN